MYVKAPSKGTGVSHMECCALPLNYTLKAVHEEFQEAGNAKPGKGDASFDE
jgi:hypothetical protein